MFSRLSTRLTALTLGGGIALAACGGSTYGASGQSPAAPATNTGMTVTTQSTSAGTVLVDSGGHTLYTNDEENQNLRCTSADCVAVWIPLTVDTGAPTAPRAITHDLSTVRRPDGTMQVAFDNRPLYTFSFDKSTGDVRGDGVADSFDGTNFEWQAARSSGAGVPAPTMQSNRY